MAKCLIKREDKPGMMLQGLALGCFVDNNTEATLWTTAEFYAYRAENEETAQAVIDFIGNVIDWEQAEQLTIVPMEEGRGNI